MPLWVADFYSKTYDLTRDERLAYLDILMKTWVRNCKPFSDDPKKMAAAVGVTVKRWLKIRPGITQFFDLGEGTWRQLRLEKEWEFVSRRASISHNNGKLGGRPQLNKNNEIENPAGIPHGTRNEPTHTHTHIEEEKGSLSGAQKEAPKRKRQVPEDWVPDGAGIAYAAERAGWSLERVNDEVEHFRDHHRTNCNAFSDVPAAWRNWVRNGQKFQYRGAKNGRGQSSVDDLIEGFGRAAGLKRPRDCKPDRSAPSPVLDGEYVRYDA